MLVAASQSKETLILRLSRDGILFAWQRPGTSQSAWLPGWQL